jgi:hypothetical protein
MSKITRAHIIAARGRKRILEGQNKPVPTKIVKLAGLDLTKFPSAQEPIPAPTTTPAGKVHLREGWIGHVLKDAHLGSFKKIPDTGTGIVFTEPEQPRSAETKR